MQPCGLVGLDGRVLERRFRNPYFSTEENDEMGEGDGERDGTPNTVMNEAQHEGYGGFHDDLKAWRAATAGLRGGWEGVEGEVSPVEEETFGEEWWERMGGYLREGLADEVRHFDGMGREVRGDGSLVGGDEEMG